MSLIVVEKHCISPNTLILKGKVFIMELINIITFNKMESLYSCPICCFAGFMWISLNCNSFSCHSNSISSMLINSNANSWTKAETICNFWLLLYRLSWMKGQAERLVVYCSRNQRLAMTSRENENVPESISHLFLSQGLKWAG